MAISMAAAVLGSAAIGAVGSALGGSAQKKAAKQAANAETQAAQMNIDAAKEFRAANQANVQPNINSGIRANSLIDSFLYGPGPTDYYTGAMPPGTQTTGQGQAPAPVPVQQTPPASNAGPTTIGLGQDVGLPTIGPNALGLRAKGALLGSYLNQQHPGSITPVAGGVTTPATGAGGAGGAASGAQSPFSGYAAFINSPYYQFGQKEGYRAINNGYAARGMLESGDAMKALTRFGQDYGYSQGLMPYLNLAGDQAGRGLQGSGIVAGVSTNALNTIANSNTAAGNAQANAALARGAAANSMYSGIGSSLGGALGYLAGGANSSSYGHFNPTNPGVGY